MSYTLLVSLPNQPWVQAHTKHGVLVAHSLGMVAKTIQQYRPIRAVIIHTSILQQGSLLIVDAVKDLLALENTHATPTLVVTAVPTIEEQTALLHHGVQYYFTENTPKSVIEAAITGFYKGQQPSGAPSNHNRPSHPIPVESTSPTLSTPLPLQQDVLPGFASHPSGHTAPQVDRVTPREREILMHIGRGATNQHIASELCISPTTVKNHLAHVFKKLKVANRTQAAYVAKQHNLIP